MTNRQRGLYLKLRRRLGRFRRRLTQPWQLQQAASDTPPVRRSGRAPDVALEATHLGPRMDEAVLRAKRQMRIGADPDYDLLYENFDVLHYLLQAPHLIDKPDLDLIDHFLENGVALKLSPHPDFSMAEYLARHPRGADARRENNPYLDWLKRGKAAGEIADPAPRISKMADVLGLEPEQVLALVSTRRRDLQRRFRTGKLGEMFARATEIEPLIGAAWTEVASPKLLPVSRHPVVDELSSIYRAQEVAGFRRGRVVLVVSGAGAGDGHRMQRHLAHALATHVDRDEVVVISTDDGTKAAVGRFPDGVRHINFARIARRLSKEQAQHALVMLVRTFRADAIVNVDSAMLYEAMRAYGRAMTVTERLFLCFFYNEQTAMGTWEGWSLRYFYRTFDHVAGVITDSEHLARRLTSTYRVGEKDQKRLHVLRAPVEPRLHAVSDSPARPDRRPQVFWAGRWSQEGADIAFEVARRMPDLSLRLWPESLPTGRRVSSAPDNVRFEEANAHITDLDLFDTDVWLYMSGRDGVPSQLLDVAMTGVPIVSSLVGGTGEVLHEDDSWPVADPEDPDAYVQAIRGVLANPRESRRRALALRERLSRERTEKEFAARAAQLLLADDDSRAGGR